jgi:hypothetical protein
LFILVAQNSPERGCIEMSESDKQTNGQLERRRVPRAALRLNATIREPGRSRVGVKVIDISTHGCRIEAISGASEDSWVLLTIAGLDTQYSRVAWSVHEFAGLEFATPLAETVLDRLLQGQSDLSEKSITELRDIATRTHRLATANGEDESLSDLSRKCAVDAVVEGLRLGDSKHAPAKGARPR